jgi:hypothetical protein
VGDLIAFLLEYCSRLRQFWFQDATAFLWLLLAIPVMISFQSIIHENTHGVVAFMVSKEHSFPKVEPFLMEYDGGFQNGITTGVFETRTERRDCDEKIPPKVNVRLAGWIGWPQVGALLITIGLALIFLFVNVTNPIFGLLWRAWYLAAAADFLFNTGLILFGTCKPTQDWAKVMIRGDHSFGWFRLLTLLLWLIIFSHFVWVWFSKWATEPLPGRGFWGYRWVAFVLGICSTISLIFYMLVRDDSIGYGSFWYIFGLVLQLVGFWTYWIYYGLSLKHSQENQSADE